MWTSDQLLRLYNWTGHGKSIASAPFVCGHSPLEADIALWVALGRTVPQTLAVLNLGSLAAVDR